MLLTAEIMILFLHTTGKVSILSKWEELFFTVNKLITMPTNLLDVFQPPIDRSSILTSLSLLEIINKELHDRYYSTNYSIDGLKISNTYLVVLVTPKLLLPGLIVRNYFYLVKLMTRRYPKFTEKLNQTHPQKLITGLTETSNISPS